MILAAASLQYLGSIGLSPVPQSIHGISHDGKYAIVQRFAGQSSELDLVERDDGRVLWSRPDTGGYGVSPNSPGPSIAIAAFSTDDSSVAIGGDSLDVYDMRTRRIVWHLGDVRINALTFTPDGKRVVAAGALPIVAAYDAATGRELWHRANGSIAISVAVDQVHGLVASGSDGGGVRLWRLADGTELPHLRIPHLGPGMHMQAAVNGFLAHEGRVPALAFTADGTLVSGSGDGSMRAWNAQTGRMLAQRICATSVESIVLDKGAIVAPCFDSGPAIFDARTLRVLRAFGENNSGAYGVWPLPHGWLVAGNDGTIKTWNGETSAIATLSGRVRAAALSPGGDLLAYTYGDRIVHVVKTAGGGEVARIAGLRTPRYGCCYGESKILLAMTRDAVIADTYESEGFVDHQGAYHGNLLVWDLGGDPAGHYPGLTASQIGIFERGRTLVVTAPAMSDTPWSVALIDRRSGTVRTWKPQQSTMDHLQNLELFGGAAPLDDDGPAVLTQSKQYGRIALSERELPSGHILRTLARTFAATSFLAVLQDRENSRIVAAGNGDGLTVLTLGGGTIARNADAVGRASISGMDVSGGRVALLVQSVNYGCDGKYHLRVFSEDTGDLIASISRPVCAQNVQISDDGRIIAVQTNAAVDLWSVSGG